MWYNGEFERWLIVKVMLFILALVILAGLLGYGAKTVFHEGTEAQRQQCEMLGRKHGVQGAPGNANPYNASWRREAWLNGWIKGQAERRALEESGGDWRKDLQKLLEEPSNAHEVFVDRNGAGLVWETKDNRAIGKSTATTTTINIPATATTKLVVTPKK